MPSLYQPSEPSHLNLNNFSDHKIAHGLQSDAKHEQGVADGVIKKWADKIRAEYQKNGDHGRGHGHKQGHGKAPLRGVYADLALDLEALADNVGQVVENFSQVAAGFALQHDGGDKEFYVDQGDALGEIHEGVADRHAEFLFFKELAEFSGQRLSDFIENHFDSGGEGVTGANGARQSVDGFGEEFFKSFEALLATVGDDWERKKSADDESGPGNGGISGIENGGESGDNAREHAQQEEVAGAELHARLQQGVLDGGDALGASEEGVERGNFTKLFVAEKSEFFVRFALRGFLHGGEAVFDKASASIALVDQRARDKDDERNRDEHQNGNQHWHRRLALCGVPPREGDRGANQTCERCGAKCVPLRLRSGQAARTVLPDPWLRPKRRLRITVEFLKRSAMMRIEFIFRSWTRIGGAARGHRQSRGGRRIAGGFRGRGKSRALCKFRRWPGVQR